jgi:hypothetical protein
MRPSIALLLMVAGACAAAQTPDRSFWCTVPPLDGKVRECFRSKQYCTTLAQCESQERAFCTGRRHPHGGPPELEKCYQTREECEVKRDDVPCLELEPGDPSVPGVKRGL